MMELEVLSCIVCIYTLPTVGWCCVNQVSDYLQLVRCRSQPWMELSNRTVGCPLRGHATSVLAVHSNHDHVQALEMYFRNETWRTNGLYYLSMTLQFSQSCNRVPTSFKRDILMCVASLSAVELGGDSDEADLFSSTCCVACHAR